MKRASTPVDSFGLPEGLAVSDIKYIRLSYAQEGVVITKTEDDVTIENGRLYASLSQEDTRRLHRGVVCIELRIVTDNGDSIFSDIKRVPCEDVINDEVLT